MAKRQMTEAQIRKALEGPRILQSVPERADFLSTGSTLLNCALTGRWYGGFLKGGYYWLLGDSDTGKTFLAMTCLAEASIDPNWDEYAFIFDNPERGSLMDIERFYGKRVRDRLQAPWYKDGEPFSSVIMEDFYYNLDDRLTMVEKGKAPPFIYVCDSFDALTTNYEKKKFGERKKHRRTESTEAVPGDYGDGKAKINSTHMRELVGRLDKCRCILIGISQTREKIDAGMFESKKTHAGGKALKFYANCQLISSPAGKMYQTINGSKRQVGTIVRIKTAKNRIRGRQWSVEVPIYNSYGIDDVGSCVDFLIQEKHWKASDGSIDAVEFGGKMSRPELITSIETKSQEFDLRDLVQDVWTGIEDALALKGRKKRYE